MSHDPSAASREMPPGASGAPVDAGPAISMRADPTAPQCDEPPAQSALALEPVIVSAGSPPTVRSGEPLATVDVLHWFG
jgi:hypothetical protein